MDAATRNAASHPLCMAAVALLVLNDHVLKGAWPGLVTGKLSDVAWLVAAPVVVAAVLARLGVAARPARRAALSGVGAAFAALQLWPPLGDAWCGVFGGSHVADVGDLLTLPALLMAPLCWRPSRPMPAALPLAALACVATRNMPTEPSRFPCDGEPRWDPNAALYLDFGSESTVSRGEVERTTHLELADGTPVAFRVDGRRASFRLCVEGGLLPDTEYLWTVGEDGEGGPHMTFGQRRFRTAAVARLPAAAPGEECATYGALDEPPGVYCGEGWIDVDQDGHPVFDDPEADHDCDDDDPTVHAGATELCDGVDQDCDGDVDEGVLTAWYTDTDGDGHGAGPRTASCDVPANAVSAGGDCDDADASVHPGAEETCDGVDQDCDGTVDQGPWYEDADLDGSGGAPIEGCVPDAVRTGHDCDDADPSRHPDASEEPCDAVDQDCDGAVDEGPLPAWYPDADGDGWGDPAPAAVVRACEGPEGYIAVGGDCDDADPTVHPGADDRPSDGIDTDCDGVDR